MDAIEYRRRASVLENGETLWRALPDRLEYYSSDGALRGVVPFEKVRRVRLAFAPGRLQTSRFLMQLSGKQSEVTLTNLHFRGIGDFEDRSETFLPLVRAVVGGVAKANPMAGFRAGERPGLYWLMLVSVTLILLLLALVMLALPIGTSGFALTLVVKLGIILVSLPLLILWAIRARPRRFDPVTGLEAVLSAR